MGLFWEGHLTDAGSVMPLLWKNFDTDSSKMQSPIPARMAFTP
jgi:hypothetical protein